MTASWFVQRICTMYGCMLNNPTSNCSVCACGHTTGSCCTQKVCTLLGSAYRLHLHCYKAYTYCPDDYGDRVLHSVVVVRLPITLITVMTDALA